MRIHLKSDFRDYYDHAFCGSWVDAPAGETPDAVFERLSTGGLARPAMLAALTDWALTRNLIPLPDRIVPWPPGVARARFLGRFEWLIERQGQGSRLDAASSVD